MLQLMPLLLRQYPHDKKFYFVAKKENVPSASFIVKYLELIGKEEAGSEKYVTYSLTREQLEKMIESLPLE